MVHTFLRILCIGATRHPIIMLDYKKLCTEILQNCKFVSVEMSSVSYQSMASSLDDMGSDKNVYIVEVLIKQPIDVIASALDQFLSTRLYVTE